MSTTSKMGVPLIEDKGIAPHIAWRDAFNLVEQNLLAGIEVDLSAGNVVLTETQARHAVIIATGALTVNRTITFPSGDDFERPHVIVNRTTGDFLLYGLVLGQVATPIEVTQGGAASVYNDGATLIATGGNANESGGGGGSGDATSIRGVPVSETAPETGQTLVYNGTIYAPATPSGGGSGGGETPSLQSVRIGPLDLPPDTPSAYDDEFNGTALDAKWTQISTHANVQLGFSFLAGGLVMEPAAAGEAVITTGGGPFGIGQPAPATGSYEISVSVADLSSIDDARLGIFVFNADKTVGWLLGIQPGFDRTASLTNFAPTENGFFNPNGAYLGSDQAYGNSNARWIGPTRLVLRYDQTTGRIYSYMGSGWAHSDPSWNQPISRPSRMGIMVWSYQSTIRANKRMWADYFRVKML